MLRRVNTLLYYLFFCGAYDAVVTGGDLSVTVR
jgi:hypothetical protein